MIGCTWSEVGTGTAFFEDGDQGSKDGLNGGAWANRGGLIGSEEVGMVREAEMGGKGSGSGGCFR